MVVGEEVTVAIGLTGQAEGIHLPITTEEGFLDVFVKKSLHWWHIEKEGKITLCPLYFVKVIATDIAESPKDLPDALVEKEVEKFVTKTVGESYALWEQTGLDPFSLKGKYHKKYGEKREVDHIDFSLNVKVKVSDA